MTDGHIYIKGQIDPDYSDKIQKKIEALGPVKKIILHIQSPGGSVYGGYNTYHTLKSLGKPIEAIIEGECMSIATLISLAADTIKIKKPSRYMIHNPSSGFDGYMEAKDYEKEAQELRRIEGEMAEIYAEKTKLPLEKARELMAKETYMTAEEALEYGFVDSIDYQLKKVALGKSIKMDEEKKNIIEKLASLLGLTSAGAPQNIALQLQDMGEIMVDTEDPTDVVGKNATVNGEPAEGEYVLADGRVLVCEAGVVTSIGEAASEPAPDAELTALKEQVAALMAENESLKTAKAEVETAHTTQLNEIKEQIAKLRKEPVGDQSKPKAGTKKKEPIANQNDDYWAQKTKEFLSESFPNLTRN